ncbi:TPA: hypothetical protein DF272_00615 [Candidatus Falkowbacteria bacterium]|nr:hypothetical protein [Candidatus Falkowbacteria bacterium]
MAKNPNKLQTALAQVFSYLISYNSFEKKLEEIRKKRQKIYLTAVKKMETDRLGQVTNHIEKLY